MFYDINLNPKSSTQVSVPSDGVINIEMKVDCEAGRKIFVSSDNAIDAVIEGKLNSLSGSWVNLVTDGLDTTPYAGTVQALYIKITANLVTTLKTDSLLWRLV